MKKSYKKINTFGQILMLVLVFLCGLNVTYAYFTARATVEGNLTFYDMNINFYYKKAGSTVSTQTNSTEFEIIPNPNESVLRGNEFKFMVSEGNTLTQLDQVSLGSSSDSCPAYVRVKVVARKMNKLGDDWSYDTTDTTDYGNFIELTYNDEEIEKKKVQESTHEVYYYFCKNVLETGGTQALATGATISTSAPVDITNCNLKITIVFEAVQANYYAAVEAFGAGGVISAWNT